MAPQALPEARRAVADQAGRIRDPPLRTMAHRLHHHREDRAGLDWTAIVPAVKQGLLLPAGHAFGEDRFRNRYARGVDLTVWLFGFPHLGRETLPPAPGKMARDGRLDLTVHNRAPPRVRLRR